MPTETPVAQQVVALVPTLVDQLLAAGPGQLYRDAVALIERPLLARALAVTGGNQLQAARLLGLNRNTLRKRCRQLGLLPPRPSNVRV